MIGMVLFAVTVFTAVRPTGEEFAERDSWVAAKFQGSQREMPAPGIIVLANCNPVQKNMHDGKPMRIKDEPFSRGLHCHAYSKLIVRLPSPGKRFFSTIGIDSNPMTSGGRGSAVFSVSINNESVFHTDVLHEGMTAVPVHSI